MKLSFDAETTVTTRCSWAYIIFSGIGYASGMLWLLMVYVFNSDVLWLGNSTDFSIRIFRLIAIGLSIVVALVARFIISRRFSFYTIIAICIGSALLAYIGIFSSIVVIKVVCYALCTWGMTYVWSLFFVDNLFATRYLRARLFVLAVALLAFAVLNIDFVRTITISIPAISMAICVAQYVIRKPCLFHHEGGSVVFQATAKDERLHINWTTFLFEIVLALLVCVSLLFCVQELSHVSSGPLAMPYFIFSCIVVFAAIASKILVKLDIRMSERNRLSFVVLFASPLLLFVPFVGSMARIILCACVFCAALLVRDLVNIRIHLWLTATSSIYDSAPRLCTHMLEDCIGYGIAYGIFTLSYIYNLMGGIVSSIVVCIVTSVVMVINNKTIDTLVQRKEYWKETSTEWEQASSNPEDALTQKTRYLTQRYGLSERQSEVLNYILRGRNAAYIADKLVISKNTARSHIYSLYKTVGVHSQQELMDYADSVNVKK